MSSSVVRIVWIAALVAVLTGCMPVQLKRYMPEGPGVLTGQLDDTLLITLSSGVQLSMWGSAERSDGTIDLVVDVSVPKATTVRFARANFVIESPVLSAPQKLPISHITTFGPKRLKPLEILNGPDAAEKDSHQVYTVWFAERPLGKTPIQILEEFTLRWPELIINDKITSIKPIRFKLYRKRAVLTIQP